MRERLLLYLFIACVALSVVSAEFDTEVIILDDTVLPGQSGQYEILVTNNEDIADRYTISSPEFSYILFVDERPSDAIEPGETGRYVIEVSARDFVNFGSYRIPVEVRSQNTRETEIVRPILRLQNPEGSIAQYAPSIALSLGAPDEVYPPEDMTLSIGLRNRNARDYNQSELSVHIISDFFEDQYATSLGPVTGNGEKTTERTIEIDDQQPPGQHPLRVEVRVGGEVISSQETSFEIIGYSQINTQTAQDRFLFKTTTTYTFVNGGNTAEEIQIVESLGIFKQLFTSSSQNYAVQSVDGQRSLVVTQQLQSLEETSITVTHNYRLLIVLIIAGIVSVIGYYLLRSPLVLNKEAEVFGDVDDNQSKLKTRLYIRNRSAQTLRNVRVIDKVSGLAEVVSKGGLGTLKPTKVVKKKSQGTLIRWDIETIEPFEERIVSYTVHTPLALVGDIALPGVKVTFEQENGKQRTAHSDDVQIRRQ